LDDQGIASGDVHDHLGELVDIAGPLRFAHALTVAFILIAVKNDSSSILKLTHYPTNTSNLNVASSDNGAGDRMSAFRTPDRSVLPSGDSL